MEKHRCPGCMGTTENAVCEKCGWPMGKNNEVHQLPVGTRLRGQYIIGRALGQGGFGITYLGWDDYLDMPVAIKEFYPNAMVARECTVSATVHCTSEQVLPNYNISKERFLREAKALARLRDVPEVVGVYGFFEENGTAYIIMEYVKGTDLATYVARKGGRLTPEEAFRILRPVMEALEMVHQAELVHRDISPDNIMLHPRGGAKLLDFGAVRNVEGAEAGKDMAHSTEAILKHGFAPAEQYKSRGGLGPWTDEYAMCATVYYCLTGRIPPQAVERMLEDIEVDFDIPGLPQHQREALTKGMAIRAKDRHGSMRKLLEALFPAGEAAQTAASAVAEPVPAISPRPVAAEPVPTAADTAPATALPNSGQAEKAPVAPETPPAPPALRTERKGLGRTAKIAITAVLSALFLAFLLLPRGWRTKADGRKVYYEHGIKRTNSWLQEEENWFFFDSEGEMVTGWWDVDGIPFYFLENGTMATDWQTVDGTQYYFGEDGVMCTGWQTVDGNRYYLGEDGVMRTDWQTVDGNRYYLGEDGIMCTGWQTIDGMEYSFSEDGIMFNGWYEEDGAKYYLVNGENATGWQMINGNKYYFDRRGAMCTSWQTIGVMKYYFGEDGIMRTGQQYISGKDHYFDENGILVY